MILAQKAALGVAYGCFAAALLMTLWRLWRGPAASDRIIALDTMTMNVTALLVLSAIATDSRFYVDVAVVTALFGFVSSVALGRFRREGRPLE